MAGAMARGGIKTTLEIYQKKDAGGVNTGDYGYKLLIGANYAEIPDDFKACIMCFSTTGETGSGLVEGQLMLSYGGDVPLEDMPQAYKDLNGRILHAINVTGFQGMNIPCNIWWAIADAGIQINMRTKQDQSGDPQDPKNPYGDLDNDGAPNWIDADDTDGPGWVQPALPLPEILTPISEEGNGD
jgi:hypothetical protein